MNFITSLTQSGSFWRSALKIGGSVAGTIGFFDPALGAAIGTVLAALGPIAAAAGVIASVVAHKKS